MVTSAEGAAQSASTPRSCQARDPTWWSSGLAPRRHRRHRPLLRPLRRGAPAGLGRRGGARAARPPPRSALGANPRFAACPTFLQPSSQRPLVYPSSWPRNVCAPLVCFLFKRGTGLLPFQMFAHTFGHLLIYNPICSDLLLDAAVCSYARYLLLFVIFVAM